MTRIAATALLIAGLVAGPIAAHAGSAVIAGPGIVGHGSFGSPLVPVPNTPFARQWAPSRAHDGGHRHNGHHRHHGRGTVIVAPPVVVVAPQVAPQPVWIEPRWAWDGWQWVWVPGHWAW